jgi:hypothetical protein
LPFPCNCCDVLPAAPTSSAGYCNPCETAGRLGRRCEHDLKLDVRPLVADLIPQAPELSPRDLEATAMQLLLQVGRPSDALVEAVLSAAADDPPHQQVFRNGDRVVLVHTDDPHTLLEPGEVGVVQHDAGAGPDEPVLVAWDGGSTLSMLRDAGDWIARLRPMTASEGDR